MNRRFYRLLALLILTSSLKLQSQSYPQDPAQTDSTSDQQQSTSVCADGSTAISLGDGTVGCPPTQQQNNIQTPGQANRQPSTAGPSENADITNQSKNRIAQQNPALQPEPLTEFQKFVAATTGQLLPIYGAKLFRNVPSTFSPNDLAPVTPEYVLGPDDELRVRIWGQVNYSGNLRVDRAGDIYLPEVGSVHVAGLQFSAVDQHLRAAVARVYRNFDLSVDIGRIRSMQVYVTGQARRPGVYTVSSLSSLVDALFASGGPSAQGSLRHIELRRNGTTVTDFDLYALLIHGDKSKDVHLLPEDVIYIPATGLQAAIIGSIQTPGIYELRNGETIGDLINDAGATTTVASNSRLSLERVGDHQVRQAMEFSLDTNGQATPLAGGDIVRVYSILPSYQKTVTLRGDVANPGRFTWHAGMHLSDLIPDRDSLESRDYWWKRSHLGLPGPEFEPFISDFEYNQRHPNRYPNYGYNPYSANPYPNNTSYPNSPSQNNQNPNLNNPDLNSQNLYNQDPISPDAQQALTSGLSAPDRQEQYGFNYGLENQEPGENRVSSGGSTLASQLNQTQSVGGTNQTKRIQVRISAPEIDWSYAVIERIAPDTLKTSLVPFDLGKLVLNHDSSQDLTLQAGDTVTVFSQADIRVPLAEQTKYITLEGEFLHAGTYSVNPGETLRDVIKRAGGITDKAYLYGSEFDRESTRVLQQQRIDEYVRRADLDAARGTLALTASATTTSGTVANTAAATSAEQVLLARLKQIRATGRVVLNFHSDAKSLDDVPAISLENGDRFTVPSAPATINVVGAVYDQNAFLFHERSSVGQYLRIAGGPDRDADWRHTFVVRADGSVVSRESVKGPWGNTFKDMKLYAGDTIIVPDKTLRPTALRGLLDWTQIFSQLAIGAAAIQVLQ